MQEEKFITTKEIAQKIGQDESYVIELCKNKFIKAKFINRKWLIQEDALLPCTRHTFLYDNVDLNNLAILVGRYKLVSKRELARWMYGVTHDDEEFGFDRIIISKANFIDNNGISYKRYLLSVEAKTFIGAWNDSLEEIFIKIKRVPYPTQASRLQTEAVFETLQEAYKYAEMYYGEIPLLEYIVKIRKKALRESIRLYNKS